ncbi:MAG: GtrA family protein [Thermoactinomyces sp.]
MFTNKPGAALFLRFCAVGLGNTAVDFAAFYLLALVGVPYLLAQALSYSAGVINSFVFNRKWTFRVTRKVNVLEALKFFLVNVFSLLVSSGLLFVLHDVNHLNLWFAKLAATGGGIVVNFIGSRLWVFSENKIMGSEIS